jgi:hypothetical protein
MESENEIVDCKEILSTIVVFLFALQSFIT